MAYTVRSRVEAQSETIGESWGSQTWLASRALGNAADITVGRVTIRPGQGNPVHLHNNGEEVLTLLSGKLKHWIGEDWVILEPGDTLTVPAGQVHHAVNIGHVDADLIVAYSTGDRDFEPVG